MTLDRPDSFQLPDRRQMSLLLLPSSLQCRGRLPPFQPASQPQSAFPGGPAPGLPALRSPAGPVVPGCPAWRLTRPFYRDSPSFATTDATPFHPGMIQPLKAVKSGRRRKVSRGLRKRQKNPVSIVGSFLHGAVSARNLNTGFPLRETSASNRYRQPYFEHLNAALVWDRECHTHNAVHVVHVVVLMLSSHVSGR